MLRLVFSVETLIAALHIATPLILAALGGSICLKSGVFNIALEGFLLIGSFTGVVVAYYSNNVTLGVLAAILMGMVFALIFGFFTLTLKANVIIAGLGLNMFALGLTTWLLVAVWNSPGAFIQPSTPVLPQINVPLVGSIPFLGKLLSKHNIIDIGAWVLAGVTYVFMHRSVVGLRLRAVGEHPEASTTAGISVIGHRYLAIALSGMLCGMGGAHMSLAALRMFSENMSAGRGFIAFTAVIFSNGNILSATLVSFLFGFFGSIAIRLEGFGVPTHFIQMIPYLMTIIILLLSAWRAYRKTNPKQKIKQEKVLSQT